VALPFVIWSCLIIFALVLLVAVQLGFLRAIEAARRRRQRALERVWLPLLVEALERVPETLPPVARRDMRVFLSFWNRLQDSIHDGFSVSLHQVALRVGADEAARRMFSSRNAGERLLAITTLGRLRDPSLWRELVSVASSRHLLLSLTAARALVRIDPEAAVAFLLTLIAERDDWPPTTISLMLQEAGPDVISGPLVDAILRAPSNKVHLLIRYLGVAHPEHTVPLLRLLIRRVTTVESITGCLRAFGDVSDLGAIRPFLDHPRWEVRVRAVDALGRLGTSRDARRLISMLSDTEWWVRYRAAQAVCRLLEGDPEHVKHLRATHGDPFARDILAHVLAEREAA